MLKLLIRIVGKMCNLHSRRSNALGKHMQHQILCLESIGWLRQKIYWFKQTQKIRKLSQPGYINTYNYTSQFIYSYLPYIYVISPIVTKVSVLSNLRISVCELRDNYYVSFT